MHTQSPDDMKGFWTSMELEYNSEAAKAKSLEQFHEIVQGDNTGEIYYGLKTAALLGVGRNITPEMLVIEIKKGLRLDYRERVVAVTTLDALRNAIYEIDAVMADQKKKTSPGLNYQGKSREGSRRFQGNCHWCLKQGHKEFECRAKKAGRPRTKSAVTKGINLQETVEENKDNLQYDQTLLSTGTNMPLSPVRIHGKKLIAGWDTGSSIGAIKTDSFQSFQECFKKGLNKNDRPSIRIADGTFVKPHGSLWVTVDFGATRARMKIYVVDGLPKDLIIGMDFMKNRVCLDNIADVANFTWGASVSLHQQITDEAASLVVVKPTIMEPHKLSRIPVSGNWKNRTYVIRDLTEQSLFIVDGTVDQDTKWIYGFNKLSIPIRLSAGDRIPVEFLNIESLNIVEASKVVPLEQNVGLPQIDINPDAPESARNALMKIIEKFHQEISKKEWGTNKIQHRIRLRDEFANRCNAYVYGPKENDFQDKTLKDMLDKGIVRPSKESNVSPVVVAHHPVSKKMRFCVNYQKLNDVTIRENHVMPRVWDTLQKLAGSDWFSKMDMLSGFWQVPVAGEDIPKTAFISNQGIFEYLFMPFGLVNASFTFQRLMDEVLGELKPNVAVPYIDDVGVHSKGDAMYHVRQLGRVFSKLLDAGLRPNWTKCKFLYQKMDFFGHVVSKDGIEIDQSRLDRVLGIKKLSCVKDVRIFLGLVIVYYRFIDGYAKMAEPLIRLTRKDVEWRWGEEEIAALESLKKALVDATFLSIPDYTHPFRMRVDSSDFAAGYYLYQTIGGKQRIIGFGGKTYNACQRNYAPGHKELYAIFLGLNDFRWCIYGYQVHVQTDHKAWEWLSKLKKIPKAIANWMMELQDYDPLIEWIPGKWNTVADALSRLWKNETELNIISHGKQLNVIDGKKFSREQKLKIVESIHADEMRGDHLKSKKTMEKLRDRFIWPGMKKDVKAVCDNCQQCLLNKRIKNKAKLTSIIASRPWNIVGVDIVGPFPKATEHDYRWILVVVDYFSKWIELIPLINIEAKTICESMKTKIFARWNIPSLIISDEGSQLVKCAEFQAMLKEYNISGNHSAVDHQQSNGQVESMIKQIKVLLKIKAENDPNKWPLQIDFVMSARNSAKNTASEQTPYYCLFGYEPKMKIESDYAQVEPGVAERHEQVFKNLKKDKQDHERQYNRKIISEAPKLAVGDQVLVYRKPKSSFDTLYRPGQVIASRGPDSYVIREESGHQGNVNIRDIKKLAAIGNSDPLIGKRVKVWWSGDRKYYTGTIGISDNLEKGTHIVYYDDGDEVYENMKKVRFKIIENKAGKKSVDYKFLNENLKDLYDDEGSSEDENYQPESSSDSESMSDFSETHENDYDLKTW